MPAARRVALVTCADLAEHDDEAPPMIAALAALGVEAEPAVWDDPSVDWPAFDLSVIRSTWDYVPRQAAFLAWAGSVPRLCNPAGVLRWNTDKTYLRGLAAAGVPVVPTLFVEPGDAVSLPAQGEYVVKPAVSAGGKDTARYVAGDDGMQAMAQAHIAALQAAGRTVMVQPYLGRVAAEGETALIYFGGAFSHAARKDELLTGPEPAVDGLFRPESISPRIPRPAELAVAELVLGAVAADLLYARVDLLPGPDGSPVLLELELTEPSVFLDCAAGAADRFAGAIVAAMTQAPPMRPTRPSEPAQPAPQRR